MDLDTIRAFIAGHPILAASLSSLWGAILIDLMSFKNSKEPGSFFATFSVRVAAWKYLQALVGGFVGNVAMVGALAGASAVTALMVWAW